MESCKSKLLLFLKDSFIINLKFGINLLLTNIYCVLYISQVSFLTQNGTFIGGTEANRWNNDNRGQHRCISMQSLT